MKYNPDLSMEVSLVTHVYDPQTDHMLLGIQLSDRTGRKIIRIGVPSWTENKKRISQALQESVLAGDDHDRA
jgi:hypothetical protein